MHLADRGRRDLKRLLNERAVPVFVRGRLPLLFRGDELLAVANLPGTGWPMCRTAGDCIGSHRRRSRFEMKAAFR
jgi:tRNA(Ile)-lysidine synthetase-like protein